MVLFKVTYSLLDQARDSPPWGNAGLRALLKGPTVVRILLWQRQGLNHQPSGAQSCTFAMVITSHVQYMGKYLL